MALDIFALLTSDGDHAQADHMFTGKAGDMVAVADVLDAVHCANRRLRAVPALASRFRNVRALAETDRDAAISFQPSRFSGSQPVYRPLMAVNLAPRPCAVMVPVE